MKKFFFLYLTITVLITGCTQEIPAPPTAAFDFRHEGKGVVVFTNRSENADSYTWHFGDDGTQNTHGQADVTHTYSRSANYNVRLIAKGEGGSVGLNKTITIDLASQTRPPKAVITYSPNSGLTAPVEVSLSGRQSSGNVSSYEWRVNNAVIANSPDTKYTFQNSGQFTITLKLSGADGDDTATETITIGSAAGPKADFDIPTGTRLAPSSLTFTNKSTGANTYHWSFGDGSFSTASSPQHEYRLPGIYNIILTAISSDGTRATSVKDIVILPRCVVLQSRNGNTIARSNVTNTYTANRQLQKSENQVRDEQNGGLREFVSVNWTYNGNTLSSITEKITEQGRTLREGKITYSYNDKGLLSREERRFTGQSYRIGDKGNFIYDYDANNVISKIQADSTTYTYQNGILTKIEHRANATASKENIDREIYTISGYEIDAKGRIKRVNYQGGASRTLEYDDKGQKRFSYFSDPSRKNKKIDEEWRYDDKVNPEWFRSRTKGHPFYAETGYGTVQNNLIWYNKTVSGTSNTGNEEKRLTGSYNSDNLPNSLSVNNDNFDEKSEYSYECKN